MILVIGAMMCVSGLLNLPNGQKNTATMPASNGRFGASGGVGSSESEQITSSFALVQTAVESPACAKPLGRCTQAGDVCK